MYSTRPFFKLESFICFKVSFFCVFDIIEKDTVKKDTFSEQFILFFFRFFNGRTMDVV
jgi:hypothetical protein